TVAGGPANLPVAVRNLRLPSSQPSIRRSRRGGRRPSGREEVLILRHVPSRRGSGRAPAGRETLAARRHRQPARREMRILELRVAHRLSAHVSGAELAARNRRCTAEVRVMHRQVHVRESRASAQRSKAAAVELAKAALAEAPAPAPPPGMEKVTRSKRKPADRAPAESESNSKAAAPAEERNISRRPDRAVERIPVSRTGPPSPTSSDIHPAPVVIRRPAPVIVRNPSPSPIRLVDPAAIAIRSPVRDR